MELLKEINPDRLAPDKISKLKPRQAVRAVIFDQNNLVALVYSVENQYHKIPGGGVEAGESLTQALARECLEETGCRISVFGELGKIIEYRTRFNLKQESFCYLARVLGNKGQPDFTAEEIAKGFMVKWVNLPQAIKLLSADRLSDYESGFIRPRELTILKKAQEDLTIY
ncbi:MAG: NUDIX domain-containing protein [Patescibacteria group bacterium]|jgi:ADP-ribose pyrophosphatase YjhB (NUDIX family)|nr:NUDIX domain-containing protein [Patescibacteria group bacterium]